MSLTVTETQLIVGAILALLSAVVAYLNVRIGKLSTVSAVHDAQLNGPTHVVNARISALENPVALAPVAGAGAVPPAWNQLNDPLPNGTLAPARSQECGEEVAAMIIMWRHGVPLSADALRAMLRRPDGSALTTAQDVANLLAMCNVTALPSDMTAAAAQADIRAQTAAGRPVAILVSVPTGGYHWICAYSSDDTHVHYIDPWGGMRVAVIWSDVMSRYAGSTVRVSGVSELSTG